MKLDAKRMQRSGGTTAAQRRAQAAAAAADGNEDQMSVAALPDENADEEFSVFHGLDTSQGLPSLRA